jgi:xanthine dehydrogenase accessory factor
MNNIYLHIFEKYSFDSGLILATVTRTAGSTPQKPGSSALFDSSGLLYGTVGGGVVEAKIQKIAAESIKSGRSGYFHYNLENDISDREEAICGGRISILVDADLSKNRQSFEKVRKSLAGRSSGVLVTVLRGAGDTGFDIERYWIDRNETPALPPDIDVSVRKEAEDMLRAGKHSSFREILTGQPAAGRLSGVFLEPVFPAAKLVIAGAGHIGKALSHLGNLLGFEVTVIDDRPDLASSDNLPDANNIVVGNIGKEMQNIRKDLDTYVVIVTRGHKDDAEALRACIGEELAYTGMIGSRKKVKAMHDSFIANGWATQEQWDAVFTPVGLEIGSQSVQEIAVSIAAQIILVKNRNND